MKTFNQLCVCDVLNSWTWLVVSVNRIFCTPTASFPANPMTNLSGRCYLQFAQYFDAGFLFLAADVYCAVELVLHVRAWRVEEREPWGQPLFPTISIRLHGESNSCRTEECVGGLAHLLKQTNVFLTFLLTQFWVVRSRVCCVGEARVHSEAEDGEVVNSIILRF